MSSVSWDDFLATDGERRTHRAWHEDGLVEFATGLWFVLFAASLLTPIPIGFALLAFVLLGVLSGRLLIASKARFVDRKSGAVRPKRWRVTRRRLVLAGAIGSVVGAVSSVLEGLDPSMPQLVPLVSFSLLPVGFVLTARQTRLPCHALEAIVAVLMTILGLAIRFADEDDRPSWPVFAAGTGVWLLVSGLLVLRTYLRAHPSRPLESIVGM